MVFYFFSIVSYKGRVWLYMKNISSISYYWGCIWNIKLSYIFYIHQWISPIKKSQKSRVVHFYIIFFSKKCSKPAIQIINGIAENCLVSSLWKHHKWVSIRQSSCAGYSLCLLEKTKHGITAGFYSKCFLKSFIHNIMYCKWSISWSAIFSYFPVNKKLIGFTARYKPSIAPE